MLSVDITCVVKHPLYITIVYTKCTKYTDLYNIHTFIVYGVKQRSNVNTRRIIVIVKSFSTEGMNYEIFMGLVFAAAWSCT